MALGFLQCNAIDACFTCTPGQFEEGGPDKCFPLPHYRRLQARFTLLVSMKQSHGALLHQTRDRAVWNKHFLLFVSLVVG